MSPEGQDQEGNLTRNLTLEDKGTKDLLEASLPAPIDIQELKSRSSLSFTSGVLAENETKKLCVPGDSVGFYGIYFLIHEEVSRPIGHLKIHNISKEWQFDDPHEKFAEISLNSGEISLWDSIAVGLSERGLMDFIGQRFHYKKGSTIYAELDSYTGIFIIAQDTLSRLTIRNRCGIEEFGYEHVKLNFYRNSQDQSLVYETMAEGLGKVYFPAPPDLNIKELVDYGEWLCDDSKVYNWYDTSGGRLLIESDSLDRATFRALGSSIYAVDQNYVYDSRHGRIQEADVETFEVIKIEVEGRVAYAKDRNHYYFWDQIVNDTLGFKQAYRLYKMRPLESELDQ